MNAEQQAELQGVNSHVNAIPFEELPKPGEGADVWKDTPDGGSWVCRDYVLAKADELRKQGWAETDMTVVLCYVETGEYHAVLGVAVEGEIWILDSRFDRIYLWAQPPAAYRWDRQQIAGTVDFRDVSATGLA
jgi:predicted transglutaminase-like cysteine proteinase